MPTRIIAAITTAALAAVLLVAGALAVGKPAAQSQSKPNLGNRVLFTVMTGRKEVDANGRRGAGDPNGRGSFSAIPKGGQLCFALTVKNVDEPVAAHIHRGRSNRNGPIVVTLAVPPSGSLGTASGCRNVDRALLRAILRNPHRYYANLHTQAFPNGAVRGQLFARSN